MQKKIKTGICSFGMSGKLFHAPFIAVHPGFELYGIVERNHHHAAAIYPDTKRYLSAEELFADPAIELVVINTPTATHVELTTAALNAGKHVVLEKPASVTAKEIIGLHELAQSKGLFFTIYQNRRYDGEFLCLKKILSDGKLGKLAEAVFRYDRFRPQPGGKQHKEGDLPGAGLVHDIGAHLIDQTIQFFGFPLSIYADIATLREGVTANDYFEILLQYNHFRVRLHSTVIAMERQNDYTIHGHNGSFLLTRFDQQEAALLNGTIPAFTPWVPEITTPNGLLHYVKDGVAVKESIIAQSGNYMDYYNDVYLALINEKENPVPATDAIKTMQVIDAAFESAAQQKVINL